MSDTANTPIGAQAIKVIGPGRMAWQYEGKCYTSAGLLVPTEVIREDDALITDGIPLPADHEVLDMVVSLPLEALPPGATLSPIVGATARPAKGSPPVVPKSELEAAMARVKELEGLNADLVREHSQTPAKSDPIGDALKTGKK